MTTKDTPEPKDTKAGKSDEVDEFAANPDDPTQNTYDIDTQGAERPYPEGKPRPVRVEGEEVASAPRRETAKP